MLSKCINESLDKVQAKSEMVIGVVGLVDVEWLEENL